MNSLKSKNERKKSRKLKKDETEAAFTLALTP